MIKLIWHFMVLLLLGMAGNTSPASAQESDPFTDMVDKSTLPVPREKGQLFYLQRDPNTNTIIYSINIHNGKLDTDHPVKSYWIRYAEKGQREKLSFLQESMAYGIHIKPDGENYQLRIKAYKDLLITLSRNEQTDRYEALVTVDNKRIVLDRIFVRIRGGSLFNPKIEYVEIQGRDKNGAQITHQFEI